jgi:nitrogen fixation NifU-like protein
MTSDCGDTMGIWLKVDERAIGNVTFWTDGCFSSIATGSMVTELAKGQSVLDALRIGQQTVLDALGGMPEDSAHCALLAADTLCAAIRDYLANEREPWKRAYRRQS